MFCFPFIDFELLTLKNFRVISSGLVCVVQRDLANQIKLQIDRKTYRPSLNMPIVDIVMSSLVTLVSIGHRISPNDRAITFWMGISAFGRCSTPSNNIYSTFIIFVLYTT